jgi:hypothetical protein
MGANPDRGYPQAGEIGLHRRQSARRSSRDVPLSDIVTQMLYRIAFTAGGLTLVAVEKYRANPRLLALLRGRLTAFDRPCVN